MYATTIGAHNHRTSNKKPLPDGVKTLSDWMRATGYFTANIHELPPPCDFRGTGKTDWDFRYNGKPFDSADWSDLNRGDILAERASHAQRPGAGF